MAEPLKAAALRGLGEPRGSFLVVDPGGRCGTAIITPASRHYAWGPGTQQLDALASYLHAVLVKRETFPVSFVVCEDYHLVGGKAMQQSGSSMPAAQGIGMCRVACEWTDTPLFLLPPTCKRAGHQALDAAGQAAYAAARNDHERDAVDIAGFVLREVRRAG